jgi:hypothetical protein
MIQFARDVCELAPQPARVSCVFRSTDLHIRAFTAARATATLRAVCAYREDLILKITHRVTAVAAIAAFSIPVFVSAQSMPHHRIVTPGDLKWNDVGSLPAGAKVAVIEGDPSKEGMTTIRIKLPANYRVPPHYHGTVERSTILSGTLHLGTGEKFDAQKASAMVPGSVLLMPPKMAHFAFTKEEVIFQLNVMGPWTVTYVNPADDPRAK